MIEDRREPEWDGETEVEDAVFTDPPEPETADFTCAECGATWKKVACNDPKHHGLEAEIQLLFRTNKQQADRIAELEFEGEHLRTRIEKLIQTDDPEPETPAQETPNPPRTVTFEDLADLLDERIDGLKDAIEEVSNQLSWGQSLESIAEAIRDYGAAYREANGVAPRRRRGR